MDTHKYKENDTLIRQKFDNYEVELPSDDWAVFSQKLAEAQPKRRRFVWYYVAAAASIIGVLFVGVSYLSNGRVSTGGNLAVQSSNHNAGLNSAKSTIRPLVNEKEDGSQQKPLALASNPSTVHAANSVATKTQEQAQTATVLLSESKGQNISVAGKDADNAQQVAVVAAKPVVNDFDTAGYITHPVKQYAELPNLPVEDSKAAFTTGKKQSTGSNNLVHWLAGNFQGNLGLSSGAGTDLTSSESISSHLFSRVSQADALLASSTPTLISFSDKKTYYVPMSFGLTAGMPIGNRWELQSGIVYTLLITTGELQSSSNVKATGRIEQHYIGVPVSLAYAFIKQPSFSVYLTGGGRIEKGISLVEKIYTYNSQNIPTEQERYHYSISGVQVALEAGIGASYRLYRFISWYAEIGGAWYVPCNQPESSRTEHPLNAALKTGLRFSLIK
ncbi:outer membrane beta-barrel protein [Paludibacter jiangxiensis]|uniref:Outer membrane protein beta-barrel domain-containing protein n=1 Tax=Paludibacter jiangxiensis TaxID=681398 RepID=A0A170YCE4_9BACT|nr:outer membrane beta-barrel protein [Paludibacter jiangxiensis]GAT61693.1 outer membrane protein beta-barrel domain-containing protein [Paludibacter jiangxiensis]